MLSWVSVLSVTVFPTLLFVVLCLLDPGGGSGGSMSDKSGFRNAESRQRYLAVYDRVRSLSPVPSAVHDVQTGFGVVRAYQDGPDGGVPLVLLHCFWATSAMWADHVPAVVTRGV